MTRVIAVLIPMLFNVLPTPGQGTAPVQGVAAATARAVGAQAVPGSAQAPLPAAPVVTSANFRVYAPDGSARTLDELIAALDGVEVVFLGEEHDDPVAHFLEAEILRLAHARAAAARRPTVLSLEMFERDVQSVIDEYLAGLISEKHFLSSSRPWGRYATDYKPMIEFAKANKLSVVAANPPGRYANRVARLGRASLADLSDEARSWLPPLPYGDPDPAYAAKFKALMGDAGGPSGPHGPSYLIDAQVLWDAGMAYSIAGALMRQPGALVVHVNGGFHSEERMGAPTQLLRYRPGTRFLSVAMVSGRGFPNFDVSKLGKLGDFVIVTDPALKPK